MDALQTALNTLIPTFFIIAVGAVADSIFPKLHIETLTRISLYFFIPALMFDALAQTDLSLSSALRLSLAYLLYLGVLGALAWFGSRGLSASQKRGVVVTSIFGNTGNMGLPITLFAYGQAGLERAVVLLVLSLTAMFVLGPALLSGEQGSLGKRLREALKLPPIWATLAGLFVNIFAFNLPVGLERGVSLLGEGAIPVLLFSLGVQMRRSWVWELGAAALRTSVFRLGLGPIIAYAVARLLSLESLDTAVLVLSAAMPAAVTMFVVAVEVKGDFKGVARSVVATTIGSLVTILLVLYLFPTG